MTPEIVARFFPPAPSGGTGLHSASRDWFAAKLLDFGEASLLERRVDPNLQAYRILFLPSLNATGDSVLRIERNQTTFAELKQTALCEDARFEGASIAVRRVAIPTRAWDEIVACMGQFFWTAPQEETDLRRTGTDGWTTLVEGVRNGEHHAVQRWCLECPGDVASPGTAGLRECVRLARASLDASEPTP